MLNKDVFVGCYQLFPGDIETIFEVASLGKTYVEIGTLFGGSACIAGMAGCEVYCIDPLDGYDAVLGAVDPVSGLVPSPEIVRTNWIRHGLDPAKLHIYPRFHPPWPIEIDRKFDVGFIDGDHTLEGVNKDYEGMRLRVDYLAFHDITWGSIGSVYRAAADDPMWDIYTPKTTEKSITAVLERRLKERGND